MDTLLYKIIETTIVGGICIYLLVIVKSALKESRLAMDRSNKFIQDRLSKISTDSTDAIKENYRTLRAWAEEQRLQTNAIGGLPCTEQFPLMPHRHEPQVPHPYRTVPEPKETTSDKVARWSGGDNSTMPGKGE